MSRKSLFILIAVIFLFTGCQNPSKVIIDSSGTNTSFSKIHDFPLYKMYYKGDYGFSHLLKTGSFSFIETTNNNIKNPWGCTCFSILGKKDSIKLGRNFDWYDHPVLLLFTDPPNAYSSVSMVDLFYLGIEKNDDLNENDERLLTTPFFPFDGMNECGLAVGMMAVPYAQYHPDIDRITIGSLQVIRLWLDYAGNIDEAVELIQNYNIDFTNGPPIHYIIADSTGKSAVIEFVDNQLIVINNEYPWQVSTNFFISSASFTGVQSICWRYNHAYQLLEKNKGILDAEATLNILQDVSQPSTIWSVIYHLTNKQIEIVMDREFTNMLNIEYW